ncbi:methyl-accepting chemotaxis protein [Sporosalibacterium faouarense]|uniref:methyl-accepting chemotaxis protein n=1 Tax=Sporosalibacterium faouarense TaxID=516123 RepID=UPI00192AE6C3|nr:methyl-accepting chemotaxis protein [Sporosalibacterium faouarense]
MKLRLKDWKITTKIVSSFITLMILFFFIIGQSYLSITDINQDKLPLLSSNEEVAKAMLEMRKNEKDFLMREVSNVDFFREGKSTYIEDYEKNYEILNNNIKLIKNNADIIQDTQMVKKLDTILLEAKTYHDNFLKVVDRIKKRGFEDFGIEGELREAIHNIEDRISQQDQVMLMLQARRAEKDYFLRHDLEYVEKLNGIVTDLKFSLQDSGKEYEVELLDKYFEKFNDIVVIEKEIGLTEDEGLKGNYREAIHKLNPLLNDLSTSMKAMINDRAKGTQKIMLVSFIVIFSIALLFSIFISRVIAKPIYKANQMLKDIAEGEGDLTKNLEVDTKDELGTLSLWFNVFTDKIKEIIALVKSNADIIALSSEEIAIATEQSNQGMESIAKEITIISDGLQNNASVIEEATAGIEEITSGAFVVSEESEEATKNSEEALNAARYGASKLKEVVEAIDSVYHSSNNMTILIEQLKDSSAKINDIASLITGISEETNLLALNASIEAARAGESGKGFVVVADEVRKLAEESKLSAHDISMLIKEIQQKIETAYSGMKEEQELVTTSVKKAEETNIEFENILDRIAKTTEKMSIISQSVKQQSEITKDMTKAMDEISEATQQSASASQKINSSIQEQVSTYEEVSASIEELSNISKTLKKQTDRFKTK